MAGRTTSGTTQLRLVDLAAVRSRRQHRATEGDLPSVAGNNTAPSAAARARLRSRWQFEARPANHIRLLPPPNAPQEQDLLTVVDELNRLADRLLQRAYFSPAPTQA